MAAIEQLQRFADLLRGADPLQLTTRAIIALAILVIAKAVYNLYIRKGHRY